MGYGEKAPGCGEGGSIKGSPNKQDVRGRTPISCASENGCEDVIKLLRLWGDAVASVV